MLKNSKIEIFSKEISKFTNLDDLLKLYQSHPFDLKILKWINKLNNPQFAITLMQISGSDFKLLHDSNQSTTYLNSITEDQKTKLTEGIGFILKYYKEMSAEYPISNSEKLIDYTQQICKKNDTQSMTNRNYLFHVYQEQIKNNIQSENINNVIELCFNIFKLKQGALFEQEANAIFDAAYHWVYEKIVSLHRDDLRPHATILKKSILFAPSPLNALEQLKVINLLIKINPAIFEDNQLAELYHSISEDLPDDNRLELYRALFGVQKIPAVLMPTIIHDMCATYSKIKNPALTTFMIEKLNKILAEESINFHIESDDLIFLIKKKFLNRNQLIRYTINNLSNYNESNRTKILNCLWKISCKDQDFLNDLTEQLNNNTDSKIESLKKCCSVLLMLREIEKRDDLKPLKITMSEPNTKELSKLLGQYTKGPLTNPTTQLKEFFASINDDSPELYIQKMMQSNITELHPIDLLKEEYEVFISKINQLNTSNTDHHDAIRNLYLMHKAGRITHENIQSAIKTKYSEYQTAIASINSIPTIKALSQGSHPILLTPLQELSTFKERLENSSNLETLTSLLNNEEFKELISTSNPPQEFGYTINKTKDLMLSILQHSQDKKEKEDLIRRIYKYELDKHSVEQQKLSENLEKSEQQSSNELFEELKYLYIVQPLVKDTVLSVPLTTDMQEKVKQQMQDNPEPFKTIKYKLPSQLQEILDLEQPILVPTNQSDNQNHPEVTTTASSTIIDNIEDKTITPPSENQTLERSHSTNNNEPLEIQSEIKNEPTNLSTRLNRYWNGFLIIVGITIVGFSFGIGSPLGIGLTCLGAAGLTRAYDQITTQHEAESLDARNRRNTIILATSLIILGLVIGSITMGIGSPLTVACVCIGLGLFSEIISANMHHHRRKKIPEQSQLLHSLQSAKAKKTKRKIKPKKSVVQRLLPKFLNTSSKKTKPTTITPDQSK